MKLTELHVEGYRSLTNVTLPLRDLMVMIGPNGSGKTALLEMFLLLKHAAEKQFADRLESLGGLSAILTQIRDERRHLLVRLSVDVESSKSSGPMVYEFEATPRETGYTFPSELLEWWSDTSKRASLRYIEAQLNEVLYYSPESSSRNDSSFPINYQKHERGGETHEMLSRLSRQNFNRLELAFAQVPLEAEPKLLHDRLAGIQFYSFLDVTQRSMVRLPQSLTPAKRPGPNGESLYSALYNLRINDLDAYARIIEILQLGFPGFQRLEFPVVGAGQVTLAWYQKNLAAPLYPNQLSEGTLRFLWLVTILLSPDVPLVALIDEPEVSLHPELLKLLAGVLQDASLRSQVIVATHSPDLIRWLEPNQVLVTEKDESGATQFTWADSLKLEEWLKEYTLRDLWLMGTLGGRP
jgi:predicted ATPase